MIRIGTFSRCIGFFVVLVLVSACGGSTSGGQSADVDNRGVNEYLPTDSSLTWHYNNNSISSHFIDDKVVSNETFSVMLYPDTDGREYFHNDTNTLAFRGFFSPYILTGEGQFTADIVLNKDLILWSKYLTPGDQLTLSGGGTVNIKPTYGQHSLSFNFNRTFHGIESIVVPYGTFDAVHVSFDLEVSTVVQGYTFSIPFSGEYWFAKGIGIVKRTENGTSFILSGFDGIDSDGDGIIDVLDSFSNNPNEWLDTDGDGTGDNADKDDDNDGIPDTSDLFPKNASEAGDFDGDGIADNADPDDDNDAVIDTLDPFPLDPTEWEDSDSDGIGNNTDADDDGDGWSDNDESLCASDSLDSQSIPLDTDSDLSCNVLDEDDDNDGYLDINDAFPFDSTEWMDTDSDGIGNNADPNDDNDRLSDIDDPRPLDASAPGEIFSISPGVVIAGTDTRIILSGDFFSAEDSFYVNDVAVNSTLMSDKAVAIKLVNPLEGTIDVTIKYSNHSYVSIASLQVKPPLYYPYAVITAGGSKPKGYFDPLSQSLFVHNSSLTEITRFQYVSGGGWDSTSLSLANLRSIGMSRDLSKLFALRTDALLPIDMDLFSVGNAIPLSPGFNTVMSDLEFDFSNKAVIVTDYQGSGSTSVLSYDAETQSATYGEQSALGRLYNSSVGVSGDGSLLILGENGLSPVQPLVEYHPITGVFAETSQTASYHHADINLEGSRILINNLNIYNESFVLIGQLSAYSAITAAAMDPAGRFVVAADSDNALYWYDTTSLSGQMLVPTANSSISEDVGTINKLVLTPDGLTVFVLGSNKVLAVPVWQIVEGAVGSSEVCPTAGCDGIGIAAGVSDPGNTTPVIPPLDNQQSPLQHVSPSYAEMGNQFEVLLTGSGFLPASVVMFDDTPATKIRYINDTEMRATIPVLSAGTYTVSVDGHLLNAPQFSVVSQQAITPAYWDIAGYPVEMSYDAINHALYSLDTVSDTLHRIDLTDNSYISKPIANASDVTWCPSDGYLYVATGEDFRQYDAVTLDYIKLMAITTVDRLECVSENNLVLTSENQWEYYQLFDSETSTLISAYDIVGYPAGILYSPTVDGVSSKGDRVYFGESGITSPDRVVFTPHLPTAATSNDVGTFTTSSWSDDGSLGVVNNREVYNDSFSLLGTLAISGKVIATSTVAPDASAIFIASTDGDVYKIAYDASNPSDFTNLTNYSLSKDLSDNIVVGNILRAESSLDGQTLFVGGSTGIEAISVNAP